MRISEIAISVLVVAVLVVVAVQVFLVWDVRQRAGAEMSLLHRAGKLSGMEVEIYFLVKKLAEIGGEMVAEVSALTEGIEGMKEVNKNAVVIEDMEDRVGVDSVRSRRKVD